MFISFFTGKVMLFYGITLIMKEKSNASALGARHDRTWEEARPNAGRRSLTGIDRGLPCLQTNGLCKIRQAPTSFTNSKYPQILNSLPYIAIRPARDAYSFFVD